MNRTVHFLLPEGVDDPASPSGGNVYDRRVIHALAPLRFEVLEHTGPETLPRLPAGATVVVDGLVASAIPDLLAPQADRLNLVILVHMLFRDEDARLAPAERQAFRSAAKLVTTSRWCRDRLLELYDVPAERVHVATPGAEPAAVTAPRPDGSRLLCVAAVAPHKGQDILIEALAMLEDLSWTCVCVGSLTRDPAFVNRIGLRAKESGLDDRLTFAGPRTGDDLAAAYAAADLLVVPSRFESYGMVVTEALARGIPVVASAAGGLPEAVGRADDGGVPGVLVPPENAPELAAALRRWLRDAGRRATLRETALRRRDTLSGWDTTARLVAGALSGATSGGIGGAPWQTP